jgi:hypothetical protein
MEAFPMKNSLLYKGTMLFCVISAFLFATQFASASTIQITAPAGFTSPLVVGSEEGSITIDDFLVTNITTTKPTKTNLYAVDITSITATIGTHADNPLDYVTSVTVSGGTCVAGTTVLAETDACTIDLTLDFVGGPPYKGHENPYGSNQIHLFVDSYNPTGTAGNKADDTLTFKTIVDFTPEPGSLLLLGSGLLGLAGVMWRKRSHS